MKTYTIYFPADRDSALTMVYVDAHSIRYFDGATFFYDKDEALVAVFRAENIIGFQEGRHNTTEWEVTA
jgi:hypothetical protein